MLDHATIQQIADAVRSRAVSAAEVAQASLARIKAANPRFNAFLELLEAEALAEAREVDQALARGQDPGPLAGAPIAVKDNICTRAGRTTCGSRMLENFRSPYDATAVARLRSAGAVIIGKTNLDEFGMGGSTENSAFGPTLNPWNTQLVPGGSSGGSAVAVAARMTPAALGTDTGGSVRQPASFCGIVGLKPSYGRVSRYGLVAYGSSLDQIGPMTLSVADAALLLSVICGHDPRDSTSVPADARDFCACLREDALAPVARGLRIGVPGELFAKGLHEQTRQRVQEALKALEGIGARCVNLSLPNIPLSVASYYLVAAAEASSNLARFDGVRYGRRAAGVRTVPELYARSRAEGFGAEVKRRIMLGTFALSAGYHDQYYEKALRVRRLIHDDFKRAFEQVDVIAGPVTPMPAWPLGTRCNDPLQMYLADLYTIPANLAGIPAISVPCGFTSDGLPVGLQLLAANMREDVLLQAARLYERETNWIAARMPPASNA